MRIIFLNCWYGLTGKSFTDYISGKAKETDIFCFSEVDPNLFSKLQDILLDHQGFFETDNKIGVKGHVYGQAFFLRKNLKVSKTGKFDIFRNVKNDMGFVQHLDLDLKGKSLFISNVHGKARPGTKLDTFGRLLQSEKIIEFAKKSQLGPTIIGGDFNLMPSTRSVKMFSNAGFKDLIKDFDIQETRNRFTWDQFPNEEKQHFADYIFISKDINVKSFEVPKNEVSDHLPLILDFEI